MSNSSLCYKCHWVVLDPGGFFKRKNPKGPCDKCLGYMTTFQIADEARIWLKYIPPKVVEKKVVQNQKPEDHKAPDKV